MMSRNQAWRLEKFEEVGNTMAKILYKNRDLVAN
jgi:hypothetical protein